MLVDVWHEQKHAWPLQEAWFTRKRREKRKMDSNWISCLFLLYFSLFLSSLSLSLSCQYSSLLTQEKQRQSFSCVFAYRNKKPFFFTYASTRSYITQILEYFCQGQFACNGQLYFQLLWDALIFRNLWRIVIIIKYLVRECYILQSLLQNCTCPHRQAGATGCQPSMAASSVSDEATNSLSTMRLPSPGQRWYIDHER